VICVWKRSLPFAHCRVASRTPVRLVDSASHSERHPRKLQLAGDRTGNEDCRRSSYAEWRHAGGLRVSLHSAHADPLLLTSCAHEAAECGMDGRSTDAHARKRGGRLPVRGAQRWARWRAQKTTVSSIVPRHWTMLEDMSLITFSSMRFLASILPTVATTSCSAVSSVSC